jgi:hypothetical protein
LSISIPAGYYDIVANIESGGNPSATSSTSSASGLFGLLNSTRNSLPGNTDLEKMTALTQSNASVLASHGLDITTQNLYAAHFLGAGNAVNVLNSDNSTPLSNVVPSNVISSNPYLGGMSVGDFKDWTASKTAGDASNTKSAGDLAVQATQEAGTFAVDVASGNWLKAGADAVTSILGAFGIGPQTTEKTDPNATGNGSSSGNIFTWITDFFSAHTATRFAFVVLGIILVGVAVVYLAANTDTGKTVINNVKEVAKGAATAAVVAA